MSDLKCFLWNNRTVTSEKNKYTKHQIKLNEWPDFGFVGCPNDYIVLSAYLVKEAMSYEQIKSLFNVKAETLNHFIYVCKMLGIINVTQIQKQSNNKVMMKKLTSNLSIKLKSIFF